MNHSILYLECNSGISGDMTVAALLDLGADRQILLDALSSLPLTGYSIEIKDVYKSGIRACDFNVILDHDNHDHDMDYLHGHAHSITDEHDHTHSHNLSDEHEQIHRHDHSMTVGDVHGHDTDESQHIHHHHHDARNLNDITKIIQVGQLSSGAKDLALKIFQILAEAEAAVHGKTLDEIHFHEVGAVDSIVDIVAVAVCIDNLSPSGIVISALTDGKGQIRCQHGLIPVPVPAVTAIAMQNDLTLNISDVEGELVTPTGAAIAAAVRTATTLPKEFRIRRIGFGAGKRDYAATGLLRAMLLQPLSKDTHDTILSLETNVDDCSGEALSYTMQLLLDAGALDAFCIPIYMKKNRPACLLKVLCNPEQRAEMESIIFRNTTTIGIRIQEMQRTKLPRKIFALETPWGMADVKCCTYGNDTYYYPENDSVSRLAKQNGTGFTEMYNMIQAYARENPHV
ncbi:MAG: nickel pincer cofactor biosynthesis protein LarC [Lachnospiraceae bacterium]|nr:nickel pincer cofactor biosynthesis protein LarC [Lachnospiraceae bacterium]